MKSLAKKIVATALTVASIATMTTCVATATQPIWNTILTQQEKQA